MIYHFFLSIVHGVGLYRKRHHLLGTSTDDQKNLSSREDGSLMNNIIWLAVLPQFYHYLWIFIWLVVSNMIFVPFHIWKIILPIDFHISQDGYCTTNQLWNLGNTNICRYYSTPEQNNAAKQRGQNHCFLLVVTYQQFLIF